MCSLIVAITSIFRDAWKLERLQAATVSLRVIFEGHRQFTTIFHYNHVSFIASHL